MVAPCIQFVCVSSVWKIIPCVIACEEQRTEPNGLVIIVIIGHRGVGDCVAIQTCFSNELRVVLLLGLNHEARNIVYDNLRAFPLVTFLCYISGGSAIDDEIERCVCGIIVSLNGAHR